jgi:hypothetical protein
MWKNLVFLSPNCNQFSFVLWRHFRSSCSKSMYSSSLTCYSVSALWDCEPIWIFSKSFVLCLICSSVLLTVFLTHCCKDFRHCPSFPFKMLHSSPEVIFSFHVLETRLLWSECFVELASNPKSLQWCHFVIFFRRKETKIEWWSKLLQAKTVTSTSPKISVHFWVARPLSSLSLLS